MKVFVINEFGTVSGIGANSLCAIKERLKNKADGLGIKCEFILAEGEGELVTAVQSAYGADGAILNAGSFAKYSIAIRDAIAAIRQTPVIEVCDAKADDGHYSLPSMLSPVCLGVISGFGQEGVLLALDALAQKK